MEGRMNVWGFLSPYGEMVLGEADGELCLCDWRAAADKDGMAERVARSLGREIQHRKTDILDCSIRQLGEYFAGDRTVFDVPLKFVGTPFQQRVRRELLKIPYGALATYSGMAVSIGNPKGVRAVASAISSNPVSIFVPCHRVIGADSSLHGYRGGIAAKQSLLILECGNIR